jgi:hypothetical protein
VARGSICLFGRAAAIVNRHVNGVIWLHGHMYVQICVK